ncbi:acyl-CoA dehydrogenase family protein [Actinokineospora soli]|uniref:Acyl-CoA dehydrogenase family protein n=1 Tax=Actinokineospora soli TaxID=1048753 RepID=A0ABW2TKX8_9PSEU
MTVTAIVPAQGFPPPPEPDLTPADVIARAEALLPLLVEQRAAAEERTYYSAEVHEEFRKAGFYRLLVPARFGGYEFSVQTFMRVVVTLARGCPSTAWMFCLGAVHAVAAATLFDERAQEEIFAGGEFIAPATVIPSGTLAKVPGGWVLDGTWPYCSGSPYATHFMGHALLFPEDGSDPRPVLFVIPRDQWTRLDDWGDQLGLKGSGSHSIAIAGQTIPEHYLLDTHLSMYEVSEDTPGVRLHANPMYGGGPMSFMMFESAVLAVGMAQGALDSYAELMRTRTTSFPPIVPRTEDPDFQLWFGEATGRIATAEAAVFDAMRQWTELAEQGPSAFTKEREWRIATICRETIRLAWTAVEKYLFPTAGSSSVRRGQHVERVWRDMSMMQSHAGIAVVLNTMANRELAWAHFGIPDPHAA